MEEKYNTLEYYNRNAAQYCKQTVEGKMEKNYELFCKELSSNAYILDFGCGSGRDSKYFIKKGYQVEAIDGSIEMCKIASLYINQEVKCKKFAELDLDRFFESITNKKEMRIL